MGKALDKLVKVSFIGKKSWYILGVVLWKADMNASPPFQIIIHSFVLIQTYLNLTNSKNIY
jgi:hypothetical protein